MKILVTGAVGFIGSHLAEKLIDLGHEVIGLDCFTPYYDKALKDLNREDIEKKSVKFFDLDLTKDDLSSITDGVDYVYHLAAQPGISASTSFETFLNNNLVATYKLLEAFMGSSSLKCFVFISTSSVYGKDATLSEETAPAPTSYYGVTKLAAEQLALSYFRDKGMPACVLRLYSVYGERERPEKGYPLLIRSIYEDKEFPLFEGSLEHLRSYTYVEDIVDGLVLVMDNTEKCLGEIFNIGSDAAITTGEGFKIVEEIIGKKAKFAMKPKRSGDQLKTHAIIEKARRVLGYSPKVKPEEGLRKEVKWFKEKFYRGF